MNYIRFEEVIDFHDRLIKKYGGHSGIRDLGLLISAINMPKQTFGGKDLHISVQEKALAYLYHIIKNHAFMDGNKRTGVFVFLVFLKRNNATYDFEGKELEEIAVAIADNKINKTDLAILFRKKTFNF